MTHRLPLGALAGLALTLVPACGPAAQAVDRPAFSHAAVDLGDVPLGTRVPSAELELRAPDREGLAIASIELGAPFEHDLSAEPLAAGERRRFHVWLHGRELGAFASTLLVTFAGASAAAGLGVPVSGHVVCAPVREPEFLHGLLQGAAPVNPTSLQFGPDDRLYVAQSDGRVLAYGVERKGRGDYAVTTVETIDLVQAIPNHDDHDGSPNPSVATRLVTGLLVTGTAQAPVVYVSSSDPRISHGGSPPPDTNSGVLTRLSWSGGRWDALDLVRGLPRSVEAHVGNGMALDEGSGTLYLAQGGHTNRGAPSTTLGGLPEYALSAAILSIDLAAIGDSTYDLPTLDDEDRPGHPDANDPFGGNAGKNQARLVPGGPVQVHSSGWRNPYDVVITLQGRMFAFDNGPNAGWGGLPIACSNQKNDAVLPTTQDQLHRVWSRGYYAGHPNPTRADPSNTFNASNPQSPVSQPSPVECLWLDPLLPAGAGGDGSLALVPFSTNGIAEYTAFNFEGSLARDLLVTSFDGTVRRYALDPSGSFVVDSGPLFTSVGTAPLDIVAQPGGAYLPGTVWVVDYEGHGVHVFEPIDYLTGCGPPCTGIDSWSLDEDGDGFKNADELLNGTSPCSAADFPPDADGDKLSDLSDPDDDDDGLDDALDLFALDAWNGSTTLPPIDYSWLAGDPGTGLLGLGFTGLMSNGRDDYLDLFDPTELTAGGAAGVLTLDEVRLGAATGALNKQFAAFQLGVAVGATTGPYYVQSRVLAPYFDGQAPLPSQVQGLFAGTGSQDDYVRLVLSEGAPQGALDVGVEVGGVYKGLVYPFDLLASAHVDLRLSVDPAAATIQPRASIDGAAFVDVGPPLKLPAGSALADAFFGAPALAVGVMASGTAGRSFTATWDDLKVLLGGP